MRAMAKKKHSNPDNVIARNKRDFVWIMARTPEIPAADYERIIGLVADMGYDISKVQKVPQRW